MTTRIISNGSKWAGEAPDTIETLLRVLDTDILDKSFEKYGNFITKSPKYAESFYAELGTNPANTYNFFGNFRTVSHVFNIATDEIEVIKKLRKAIRANQKRPEYLSQ
jgi:hypothetical protein